MPSSSPLATLRTNLQTQLRARAGLTGVTVMRHSVPPDQLPDSEHIMLLAAAARQEFAAHGASHLEEAQLDFRIRARKPGAGETVADAAEDRALALLAEVETQLRDDATVNGAVMVAWVAEYGIEPDVEPGHRICTITGTIAWKAHLT